MEWLKWRQLWSNARSERVASLTTHTTRFFSFPEGKSFVKTRHSDAITGPIKKKNMASWVDVTWCAKPFRLLPVLCIPMLTPRGFSTNVETHIKQLGRNTCNVNDPVSTSGLPRAPARSHCPNWASGSLDARRQAAQAYTGDTQHVTLCSLHDHNCVHLSKNADCTCSRRSATQAYSLVPTLLPATSNECSESTAWSVRLSTTPLVSCRGACRRQVKLKTTYEMHGGSVRHESPANLTQVHALGDTGSLSETSQRQTQGHTAHPRTMDHTEDIKLRMRRCLGHACSAREANHARAIRVSTCSSKSDTQVPGQTADGQITSKGAQGQRVKLQFGTTQCRRAQAAPWRWPPVVWYLLALYQKLTAIPRSRGGLRRRNDEETIKLREW